MNKRLSPTFQPSTIISTVLFSAILLFSIACGSKGSGSGASDDGGSSGGGGQTPPIVDTDAPSIGSAISFSAVGETSMTVSWGAATDNITSTANLEYRLVKATAAADIDTINEVDAISGADLLKDYSANITSKNVTGLGSSTTYFFAVVVRDAAGNKAIYAPQSQTTAAAGQLASPSFSPNGGTFTANQSITINGPAGSTICYTIDGGTPAATTAGTCSTGTTISPGNSFLLTLEQSTTVKAIATENGKINSTVATSNAFIIDKTAPTAGAAISFSNVTETEMTVNWGAASDNITSAANLQYRLVKASSSSAIDSITKVDLISGADLLFDYQGNTTNYHLINLSASTTYFFAVVVKDQAGHKTLYAPQSQTTNAASGGDPLPSFTELALGASLPANMAVRCTPGSSTTAGQDIDAPLSGTPSGTYSGLTNVAAASFGIRGLGADGISILNTATASTSCNGGAGSGFISAIDFAVDTTGKSGIAVSFATGQVVDETREWGMRFQYSTDGGTNFTDLITNGDFDSLKAGSSLAKYFYGPIKLPISANNNANLVLRWRYYATSGNTGSRTRILLDDIVLTDGNTSDSILPTVGTLSGDVNIVDVNLNWSLGTDDKTPQENLTYLIYRSQIDGFIPDATTLIYSSLPNQSIYKDYNLTGNTSYYYKIKSVDSSNNASIASNQLVITTAQEPIYRQTFDSLTKAGYGSALVGPIGFEWRLDDALIGDLGNDRKMGTKSIRFNSTNATTTGILCTAPEGMCAEMVFNVPKATQVRFYCASYVNDNPGILRLESSVDDGASWSQEGATANCTNSDLIEKIYNVNYVIPVRFRLVKTTTTANSRLNVDTFQILDY